MSANHIRVLGLADPDLCLSAPSTTSILPLSGIEAAAAYLWRVRDWELSLDFTMDGPSTVSEVMPIARYTDPTSEADLILAHRDSFTGNVYTSFDYGWASSAIAMSPYFALSGGAYLFQFEFNFQGVMDYVDGEDSISQEFFCTTATGYDGESISITVQFLDYEIEVPATFIAYREGIQVYDYTLAPLVVVATSYWEHESVSGLPVFDTATGAVLNSSLG
jgi:hypothetical protein